MKSTFNEYEKLSNAGEVIAPELESQMTALEWLDGQSREALSALSDTFYEKYSFGRSPFIQE